MLRRNRPGACLYCHCRFSPVSEITCKLWALQGLATAIRIEGARETLQAVEKAVVSLRSAAMNHPSRLLRHAAFDARNAWLLLDCRVHGYMFDHFLLEACEPGRKQDALTSLSGAETRYSSQPTVDL
jgi:hypothetical protein